MRPRSSEGWKREVEAGKRLQRRQPGHHKSGFDPAGFAQRQLFHEQAVDRLERGCLATFELTDDDVDDLQRARHAQPDQRGLDAVDEGGRG